MTQEDSTEKLRILAADDSRVILKAIQKILGAEYDVIEAKDGEEAWAMLKEDPTICAVFTDMQMPHLDGFGLLKCIRESKDKLISKLPVVLVTSAEDNDDAVKEAFSLGITDLVRKPFDTLMLQACARAHVKAIPMAPAPSDENASVDTNAKLANRTYFLDRGEKDRAYSMRKNQAISVAVMGIDDFPSLKSKYSGAIKPIITKVSTYMREIIRQEDTLAYLGPGQFGVIMVSTSGKNAEEILQRIVDKLRSKNFNHKSGKIPITISAGLITSVDSNEQTFDDLIKIAKTCLGKAIEDGGDRVCAQIGSLDENSTETSSEAGDQKFELLFKLLEQSKALAEKHKNDLQEDHTKTALSSLLPILKLCNEKLELGIENTLNSIEERL